LNCFGGKCRVGKGVANIATFLRRATKTFGFFSWELLTPIGVLDFFRGRDREEGEVK
jgi:hypothetical protein